MVELSTSKEKNSNLFNGNQFFSNGDYEKAIQEYLIALSKRPEFYIYHENIGWCHEKLGDVQNAKIFYGQALELNAHSARAKAFLDTKTSKIAGALEKKSVFFPEIHNAASQVDKQTLKNEYFEKKLHLVHDDFVLIRIIGNDLYPRHKIGQSRENVEFILQNEPELDRCKKIWIVNRIFDKNEFNNIVSLLEKYKQEYHVIPFIEEEYKAIGLDYSCLPHTDYLYSEEFEKLSTGVKQRVLVSMLRLKNNYVMNNNGARNYALNLGKTLAKWVMPWDGNCFVNKASWSAIKQSVLDEAFLKHFAVPMARITSNSLMLQDDYIPDAAEEPQIVFRHDTQESFNENYCYGRRPKVELFWRLGIPGSWDTYKDDQWDQPRLPMSSEAYQFGVAGWTARLFSGMAEQETQNTKGSANRNAARQLAICLAIQLIDKKLELDIRIKKFYDSMENIFNYNTSNEHYSNKYKGKKIIYVHRSDGLGERLKAITNGFALSKLLSAEFRFFWKPKKGEDASFHAIDNVHNIFSNDFISAHHIDEEEASWLGKNCAYKNKIDEIENDSIIKVEQTFDFSSIENFDYGSYFYKIKFSERICAAIKAAEEFSSFRSFNAIHIRGGDIVYGKYRLFERFQRKAMPLPLALELAKRFKEDGKEAVIFAQDESSKNAFYDKSVSIIDNKHYQSNWGSAEIAFFEIMLMSKAEFIISGSSGFSDFAARISGKKVSSYLDFLTKKECSESIKETLSKEKAKIDDMQAAYSYYMAYNISKENMPLEEKCYFLEAANNLDSRNFLYLVKITLECIEFKDHDRAKKYCQMIFKKIESKEDFSALQFCLQSSPNLLKNNIPDSEIIEKSCLNLFLKLINSSNDENFSFEIIKEKISKFDN